MTIPPQKIKKILFISLSNIGDAILTTPALDLARRFFRNAEITVMAGPRAQEVFLNHPQIQHLIIYDKHSKLREKISWMIRLKEEHFDLVIDLKNSLIPWLIQPRFSTGLIHRKKRIHASKQHLSRLMNLGIDGPSRYVIPQTTEDHDKVLKLLSDCGLGWGTPYIVIGPGAASSLKQWEIEKFKALGDLIRENHRVPIVIVGAKADRNRFLGVFPRDRWINLSGELTLQQLGVLLKYARLFVTNDSGPMHLAAALSTPVVAIFGPTDHRVYGPEGAKHRIVRLDLPCSPCMAGHCLIKTHDCIKKLEVAKVYQSVCEVLQSPI